LAEEARIEAARKAEEERLAEEARIEAARKAEKIRIEEERLAEEARIDEEKAALVAKKETLETEEQEKIAEQDNSDKIAITPAEEKAIIDDIRIQILIDKNNEILNEQKEREEQEKQRLLREAEERAQVEEQIRKEEEKLVNLKKEKGLEDQNKLKLDDSKRIEKLMESNSSAITIITNEKQMNQNSNDIGTGNLNPAFVEEELSKQETAKSFVLTAPLASLKETLDIDIESGLETKVAIEQAKTAAEITVANIEEVLTKKSETRDDSNGTFENMDIESGSIASEKKDPMMKKLVKLCGCNIL